MSIFLPCPPVAAARVHGFLACALIVQTALQFLLKAWSEVLEILLFVAVTGGFVLAAWSLKGVRGVVGLVTDTWIQRLAALFLGALAVSFLWGDQSGRSFLALLRLPTYLIVIGIVLESLRGGAGRMRSLAWTALGAISLVYGLAIVEFFWGSDALGLTCTEPACSRGPRWRWGGLFGNDAGWPIEVFVRHGGILRASMIGHVYNPARLGLFGIAAYVLGMGLVLNSAGVRPRLIAGGLASFCLLAVMLSGSRSAALTVAVLSIVFTALTALRTRTRRLVRTCVVANLVVFGVLFGCWATLPAGITVVDRLVTPSRGLVPASRALVERFPTLSGGFPDRIRVDYPGRFDLGAKRRDLWDVGWELFSEHPVGGAGFRMFQPEYARRRPDAYVNGVHSGYLKVLAEAGLVGGVLFLALVGRVLTVMTPARAPGRSSAENVWRVAFLSAFIGMLAVNVVDTHSEDRFFWIVLGFAAAVESWNTGRLPGRPSVLRTP